MLQRKRELTRLCGPLSNQKPISGFKVAGVSMEADFVLAGALPGPVKNS